MLTPSQFDAVSSSLFKIFYALGGPYCHFWHTLLIHFFLVAGEKNLKKYVHWLRGSITKFVNCSCEEKRRDSPVCYREKMWNSLLCLEKKLQNSSINGMKKSRFASKSLGRNLEILKLFVHRGKKKIMKFIDHLLKLNIKILSEMGLIALLKLKYTYEWKYLGKSSKFPNIYHFRTVKCNFS